MRQLLHDTQSVVPQRLNLDRLARPRGDDPIADLGVHPGELNTRLTAGEQSIFSSANAISRALDMPIDDVLQTSVQMILNEGTVAAILQQRPYSLEEPQCGVHSVVLRRFVRVGKAVRQHSAIGR